MFSINIFFVKLQNKTQIIFLHHCSISLSSILNCYKSFASLSFALRASFIVICRHAATEQFDKLTISLVEVSLSLYYLIIVAFNH